uniref:Uncharacterized protein n=1 Tax=Arundo donax TaxID=35708 RepID=A0A0A9HH70_ARUDO
MLAVCISVLTLFCKCYEIFQALTAFHFTR